MTKCRRAEPYGKGVPFDLPNGEVPRMASEGLRCWSQAFAAERCESCTCRKGVAAGKFLNRK